MSNVDRRAAEILSRLPDYPVTVAEVGVWDGQLSELLLRARDDLTLVMVDRWEAVQADHRYATEGSRTLGHKPAEEFAAAMACARDRTAFAGDRVKVLKGESVQQAGWVLDGTLTMCFLDADHSYDGVSEDLRAWWPKVMPGGYMAGHDWKHPAQGQVEQAVHDWQRETEVWSPIEEAQDRCWFMLKRRAAA